MPSDNGNYSCLVSNHLGRVQRFFKVMISPRLVAQKPQIDDNFPGNKTLALGSEVTMECPIILNDSFDPAEMWWFKVTKKLGN